MGRTCNIYCDESCHLEKDAQNTMVLGALWCSLEKSHSIAEQIREIKTKHGLSPNFEIKWTKVSPAKVGFYLDIVKYFFDNDDLAFRALVIPDKSKLRHEDFGQSHDEWYYKMYFNLLKVILEPKCKYRIYLDIKDTQSQVKVQGLKNILANNILDFSRNIIEKVQQVRSHEVEEIQLTDLLIGAVSYVNRKLTSSEAKTVIAEHIKKRTG